MRLVWASIVFAALVGAGCAARIGLSSEEGEADGVVYHLPKTLLEITVRQYSAVTADGNVERVWYALGGPDSEFDAKGKQTTLNDADNKPERAALSRIRSLTMPDPEHRYVINYHPSGFSDDRMCVSRQADGLLHDVHFAADDRTPEVVFNIARFIAGFIGDPVSEPVAFDAKTATGGKTRVRSYTNKVDPFNCRDVSAFNNAMGQIFDSDVQLDFTKMRRTIREAMGISDDRCDKSCGCLPPDLSLRCDPNHICYRTKLSLPVHLKHLGHRVDVKYADVVNAWDVGAISVERAMLVQKITKLRFEQGALVSAVIRKPSEVEEASLLPVNVMTAILSVPSGMIQGAFSDYTTKNQIKDKLVQSKTGLDQFKKNYDRLLLEGEPAIGIGEGNAAKERYELSCTSGERSGLINILGPGSDATDFQAK